MHFKVGKIPLIRRIRFESSYIVCMWMRELTEKSNKMEIMLCCVHRNECESLNNMRPCQCEATTWVVCYPSTGTFVRIIYGRRPHLLRFHSTFFHCVLHKIMPPFSINTPSKFRLSKRITYFARPYDCLCVCV